MTPDWDKLTQLSQPSQTSAPHWAHGWRRAAGTDFGTILAAAGGALRHLTGHSWQRAVGTDFTFHWELLAARCVTSLGIVGQAAGTAFDIFIWSSWWRAAAPHSAHLA